MIPSSSLKGESTKYRLTRAFPSGCEHSRKKCDYFLGINTNSGDNSLLEFTLEAKANGWVAVGFSKTPNMVMIIITILLIQCMTSDFPPNSYPQML